MRIGINFHTKDKYISGVEHYSLGLIRSLLHIDSENHYVVFTNMPTLIEDYIASPKKLVVRKLDYLKTRFERILWEHFRLPKIIKTEGLDVLHCPHYILPFKSSTVPYVVTIHDTIAIDHPKWCTPSNALYYNLFMKSTVKKASRVIAPSHSTVTDLKRNFSMYASKFRVIHPGIDTIFNNSQNFLRQAQVKARYNLPEKYILYVGNIEPKKNMQALLRVQKKLQEKSLPHRLVIVGKRSWGSIIELEEIAKMVKSKSLIATGYVDRNDLPFIYKMADVYISLSLYEGFGFTPLEAMASGIPVVSSSRGSLNETIAGAALTVDPYNIAQITQAVLSMITNSTLRDKHIRLGLRKSCLFNWEKAAKQTLSIYEEAIASNGQDTK
ncbi:glycosyltransferase family 4 protein [Planctomycetota bacterium]